jgi:hypothetical protein
MVFLPPPSDLALYLNGLSLLFNVYASQKPGVAAKLEELIHELKGPNPSAQLQTRADLDRRLEEKLLPEVGPVETEAVKRDMDLVAVFSEPIRVEDFDYLSTISIYGSKYAALADKASLFDLRGATLNGESWLILPTAGAFLFRAEELEMLLCPYSKWPNSLTPINIGAANAVLTKAGGEFRLIFSVLGNFKHEEHQHFSARKAELSCRYVLVAEGRKNWIKVEPQEAIEGFQWLRKRLSAEDVLKFMQAVRGDVMRYVSELREETSLIKGGISSLLQEVTQFFEKSG